MRTRRFRGLALSCCMCGASIACGTNSIRIDVPAEGIGGSAGSGSVVGAGTFGGNGAIGGTPATGGSSHMNVTINTADNTTPTEVTCAQNQVPIQVLPPDIMIVMDRSMSMTDDENGQPCAGSNDTTGFGNCGTNSKWYKTIEALKSVVSATQREVNWGMFWLGDEPKQCGASKTPVVPITPRESYAPIQQALEGNAFAGKLGTPTALAVNNALAYMKTLDDPNPKYLLLATDGEPNCAGGKLDSVDTKGATDAVASAAAAGMPTFVVGIATTSSKTASPLLDSMAVAGGRAQSGAATQYYAVSDTETLETALKQILAMASSCAISLQNVPTGEYEMAISAEDESGQAVLVPESDSDGWIYSDSTSKESITFVGGACEKLKKGIFSNVQFVYTCPGRDIVL